MNANAKLWVEELRSGKYKQGKNHLHCGDTYCCLGVACQLYCENVKNILNTESKVPEQQIRIQNGYKYYDGDSEVLPKVVREWLGLDSEIGFFKGIIDAPTRMQDRSVYSLTKLNDSGCSFKEIADIIEQEPEGLFVTEDPVTL